MARPGMELNLELAVHSAPRFLVLDFSGVVGVDSTSARTIGGLRKWLLDHGVELVITGVNMEKRYDC